MDSMVDTMEASHPGGSLPVDRAASVIVPGTFARNMNRLASLQERIGRSQSGARSLSHRSTSTSGRAASDANQLPPSSRRKDHSCSLCGVAGHKIGNNCPILSRYPVPPIKAKEKELREILSASLADPHAILTMPPLNLPIQQSWPSATKGIVLFRRYYIRGDVGNKDSPANYCFECSVLDYIGQERQDYQHALFSLPVVQAVILTKGIPIFNLMGLSTVQTEAAEKPQVMGQI